MSKRGPEQSLQVAVVEFAGLHGWRCYHPPDNSPRQGRGGRVYVQNSVPGFPDLTLTHERMGRLIWAELKADKTYPSPAQRDYLAHLTKIAAYINPDRIEVKVWKPKDWPQIVEALQWLR